MSLRRKKERLDFFNIQCENGKSGTSISSTIIPTKTRKRRVYINSEENLMRSLNVYYAHSVMGKRKYNNG